jgi:hypothetical protein
MTKVSFEVDLADLDSLKARVPELEQIVEEKKAEATAAAREYREWSSLLSRLRGLLGPEAAPDEASVRLKGEGSPTLKRVVHAIDSAGRPLRAADVQALIPDVAAGTIGWALSTATSEGLIKRVGYGIYASTDWDRAQPELPAGVTEENLED